MMYKYVDEPGDAEKQEKDTEGNENSVYEVEAGDVTTTEKAKEAGVTNGRIVSESTTF